MSESKPERDKVNSQEFFIPLEAIPIPTLVLSPDFTMVAANEARFRVTGTKRDEIIGRNVFDVFPDNPNDPEAEGVRNLRASLQRVLRDKVTDKMAIQKYDIPVPGSEPPKFEEKYWSPKNIPILDSNGEVQFILHQVEDVTKFVKSQDNQNHNEEIAAKIYHRTEEIRSANVLLKLAKEELEEKVIEQNAQLRKSEERYREIANAIPQVVWTARPDGFVDWYNDFWYEYTGVKRDSHWDDDGGPVHPDDLARTWKLWEESLATGKGYEIEYRFWKQSEGQYRWHLGRAVPVIDHQGQIVRWIGSMMDIHDQKTAEREAELARQEEVKAKEAAEMANEMKSAFLANMSHEIRTPLGAIIGFTDLLKEGNLDNADRDEFLEVISRNGRALTKLIDDILDLAKVEAGRLGIEQVDFSLYEVMSDAVELFREKARQKKIYLLLEIDKDTPVYVCSDPSRLRQIVVNLIGNAVKFTSEGGVRVSVKLVSKDNGNVRIQIDIKDTGIGLSEEQQTRLFTPFAQADNSMTRKYGGTGLGLALSKRLSEALGGSIKISECVLGKGCTFSLIFTGREGRAVQDATESNGGSSAPNWNRQDSEFLQNIKVLAVDDSPENLFLVNRILKKSGAIVDTAENGEEAVRMVNEGHYDIVLMDLQMPKMDGYQSRKIIAQSGYKRPIVALTAHAMKEERERTKIAGFSAHLTKPLDKDDLINTIARLVKGERVWEAEP